MLSPFPYRLPKEEHGMKMFIELDILLNKTPVCMHNEHGRVVQETQVASDPEALSGFVGTLPGTVAS